MADVEAAETDKTAEAAVGEGAMVQTPPPPTKTDIKLGAAVRMDAKEVGRSRRDGGLMGMGPPCGQPSGAHRRRWDQPFGAHRRDNRLSRMGDTSVKPDVRRPQEKVRLAVRRPQTKGKPLWGQPFGAHRRRCIQLSGAHRTLVRPAIAELTVRAAIGAHKNISESYHAALTVRRTSRRSQNIGVACHRGAHSEACHRGTHYVH